MRPDKPRTIGIYQDGHSCEISDSMLLLQDIKIPEMGFPKLEYIQLRAGRVPVGHEFLPLTVCTSAWVNHFRNFNIL